MAVRIANDFKTEFEMKVAALQEENCVLKRKCDDLSSEMDHVRSKKSLVPSKPSSTESVTPMDYMDYTYRTRIDPVIRLSRSSSNQLSIKSLIQNMENTIRQANRSPTSKLTAIRRRDENIVRSDSNLSLESTENKLDFDKYLNDDEPSVSGDGFKSITLKSRSSSICDMRSERKDSLTHDPLGILAKGKGSKRNALLKWVQDKTSRYSVRMPSLLS